MKGLTRTATLFVSVIILFASLCAAQQSSAPAQRPPAGVSNQIQLVIEGKVINVHDGDTVTVLDQDNKKFHIRLAGIDAPELKQEVGAVSQKNLSRMVLGKQVTIYWSKIDKYGRTVGTILLAGHDVNIEQVKAGLAWHFKKYADEQPPADRITYAAAEEAARAAKLGLWQDEDPTAPGDWRQAVKTKRWGPPPPPGTIIGNKNSMKYHRPDCSGYRDMAEANRVFFKTVAEAEAAGYKRAGNCPAAVQVVTSKSTSGLHIVNPAPSSTAPVSYPEVSASSLMVDPMLTPKVTGHRKTKVYSLPGCSDFAQGSTHVDLVVFGSVEDAEKAGYKLAANCAGRKTSKATSTVSMPPQ